MPVKDWLPAAVRSAAIDRKLKSGETLFRLGDKTAGLCEVIAGRVRLARVDRSGREIVLHVAGPGETVAEASLFASSYHCDAIASTDAVVRIYPKPAVLAAFEKDPKAAQAFAATLARQVMNLRTRIEQRNIRSARERVRNFLALNAGADRRTVALRGTLKDLAAELGLTHEALYRTLAVLERAGEIRRAKGKITLLRPRRI
ncbi:MAG TPA: Crp/Fnr family transcriptional regulator [Pseudolabrys sp.]|jgi:CRP-like cAMP-binding protein